MASLREQVTALRQELAGEKIVHQRLHDYVEKLLKRCSELEDELEFLRTTAETKTQQLN